MVFCKAMFASASQGVLIPVQPAGALYPDDAMPLLHKVSIHVTSYQKELASPHCCFGQSASMEHKTLAYRLLREAVLYKAGRYFTLLQDENHGKHYVPWTFRTEM